tara:strand:- start:4420 stop:4605 length:186 start_codon:yes stop_codon:yes gene_type:complete
MMQLKLRQKKSIKDSFIGSLIKIILAFILFIFVIFVVEKFDFPSPKQNFKIDITNEINKLK